MKKTLLGIAFFLVLPLSICHAEDVDGWRTFDIDKNNALNIVEFGNYKSMLYIELDTNLDGRWTRSEFITRPSYMRQMNPDFLRSKFKRWDKDGDGFWTLTEAEKMIKNNFRWLDKDKSKTITVKEMPKNF